MAGIDTNILVRWLVADDPVQSARASALFGSVHSAASTLLVPLTVVLELEWVLRSRYRFDKADILQTLGGLLSVGELEFQMEDAVEYALHAYRHGDAGFADCLHAGICRTLDRQPLMTFDTQAARLPKAELPGSIPQ
jgi:predicted nucleic-acid-binding protein